MSDIVDRLREDAFQCFAAATPGDRQYIGELLVGAADEIDRLRAENYELQRLLLVAQGVIPDESEATS